jgi:hypothetical protein
MFDNKVVGVQKICSLGLHIKVLEKKNQFYTIFKLSEIGLTIHCEKWIWIVNLKNRIEQRPANFTSRHNPARDSSN